MTLPGCIRAQGRGGGTAAREESRACLKAYQDRLNQGMRHYTGFQQKQVGIRLTRQTGFSLQLVPSPPCPQFQDCSSGVVTSDEMLEGKGAFYCKNWY